ncbi:MAG: M56 family metallopeptidase [Pirellulales bacterium]
MSTLVRFYPGDRGLDFLLVVTLGVALASSAAWFISRRLAGKAALRHLVLFSALIGCLASPAVAWVCVTASLTLVSIPLLPAEPGKKASGVAQISTGPAWTPPRRSTDPPPVAAELPSPQTNTTTEQSANAAAARAADQSPARPTPAESEVQPSGSAATTLLSFRGIATGAMFVWAAGTLLMLARLARNCGRVVQLRRSSRPVQDERHNALLQEVAGRLGTRQVPPLLVSNGTVAPLAVGFGRPAIIVPERLLAAVSNDELRDILMHEVAHLGRGDQRIVLLQELAGALYWPIVSVHGLNRELRRAREELCDNVVLASRDAIRYGETLLHVAQLLVQARPMDAAVGIFGGQGELERRISGLIDPRRNTMTTTSRKAACVVIFLFIAGGLLASETRFASAQADPAAQAGPAAQAAPPDQKTPAAVDTDDLKRAGHFSGRVTGPDRKPVQGARVFLVPYSIYSSPEFPESSTVLLNRIKTVGPVRARTDADGRFALDAPDMTYTTIDGLLARRQGLLIATAEGLAPDWIGSHRDPLKGAELNLHLATADVPIHGRFLGPDGRPVADARVRLTRLMIPRRRDLDTYLAYVTNENSAVMNGPSYERSLSRPDLVPGLITDTRTDADGRFTLSGLGRDRLAELAVSAPSVVDTSLTVMTRNVPDVGTHRFNGEPREVTYGAGFTLQLKPGRTIKGRVIDRGSGEPIAGMWVGPVQDYRAGVSSRLYPWVTDKEGRFTITGLPPKLEQEVVMAVAPPGVPYQMAGESIVGKKEVEIRCPRGIPSRLKVVDEQGRPVEAEVTYIDVHPNPHVEMLIPRPASQYRWPNAPAARRAHGTYEGFVLPGPGAVLVNTPRSAGYRRAHVDPKAFFAPGRTNWTKDQEWAYGTDDTLTILNENGRIDQTDYEAIVLVNPAPSSGPVELSATVVKDRPRQVNFIDPNGNPVHNVEWTPYGSRYHAHLLPLRGLHPDRARPLTYWQEERRLIGFLLARGDGDSPYTVRMQPWGAVTGRIVDWEGEGVPGSSISVRGNHPADADRRVGAKTDEKGRFQIDKLIPGHRYSAKVHRDNRNFDGRLIPLFAGVAFEDLELGPGEVRDLGEIRTRPPVYEEFPLIYEEYEEPGTKPED